MHKYEITLYWSNEDRAFRAEVPELAGCMAHGVNRESTLRNTNDAVQLWTDGASALGRLVPEPTGERLMLA